MRRLRYQVACSLDGYIASPEGELDWITHEPEIDRVLKEEPGKDIWLFGGGETFRHLWNAGLVDAIEPAIVPVLLGGGIPMLPAPADRAALELRSQRVYPSGIVWLEYDVAR